MNPFYAQVDCGRFDSDGALLPVAQMLWPTDYRSEDETNANAVFIVRACNNHDALLEALQWIADNYENGQINHVDFRVEAKHRADAVIAAATDAGS